MTSRILRDVVLTLLSLGYTADTRILNTAEEPDCMPQAVRDAHLGRICKITNAFLVFDFIRNFKATRLQELLRGAI